MVETRTPQRRPEPRWDSGKPQLSLLLSACLHSLALMGFVVYHIFPPKHASTVPTFEMVNLEPPKLRPLQPKTIEPPPPKPPETRAPDAPKLTHKAQPAPKPKPEPKVVRHDEDSTKKVDEIPKENQQLTTTIKAEVPADPRLSFWIGIVQKRVEHNWNPPEGVSDVAAFAKTQVTFQVARDGTISDVTVSTPSGNSMLDDLARQAIVRVDHVPPIPENYPGDQLQVGYDFIYHAQ